MARIPTRSLVVLGALLVAGCKNAPGSTIPVKPYRGERRPDPAFDAHEEETLALRNAVPVEIDRTEAYFAQGHREQTRIRNEIPKNPWDAYEYDLVRVIGPDLAKQKLGGRLPRPRGAAGAAAPAAGPATPAPAAPAPGNGG